ncbi:sulfotransferase family protein [Rhizobium sp. NPDC090279]|uniref:sulfotransferase family protein n=1 Tax=Rhizobium sp. NPDC090279 TaxID=3364499 RepID=UPI00383BEFBE
MQTSDPTFIIGTQKSGTTWLRDCLDKFVPFCKPEWYYPQIFSDLTVHTKTYGASLSDCARDLAIRELCQSTWRALNGGYLGEKSAYPCSPELGTIRADLHPFAVSIMRQHIPNAKVVVIVRDPRAVFNSLRHYLEHFRPGWSMGINPQIFAENWSRQNLQWVADKPDSVVLYEKLKNEFGRTMETTLKALGIYHSREDLLEVEAAVYDVDKLRTKQPEIYRTGEINEWQEKVEPETAKAIIDVAAPAMREIGYDV